MPLGRDLSDAQVGRSFGTFVRAKARAQCNRNRTFGPDCGRFVFRNEVPVVPNERQCCAYRLQG